MSITKQMLFSFFVILPLPISAAGIDFRKQVEADWLLQEGYRSQASGAVNISPEMDAAGAVDGIKNGKWPFHTGMEKEPWWQVDLGSKQPIARVLIWNRSDSAASRASRLRLRLSDDGKTWRTVYQHNGKTFYGYTDKKPLVVELKAQQARFVRAQLPGTSYFHLDEVEVFGPGDPEKNLALRKPALQSSVSQWSSNSLPQKPRPEIKMDTEAQWAKRRKFLSDPLLDFDDILFTKRVPGSFSHMSDQYYGWWSRPGGGIFILKNFKSDSPSTVCITESFNEPGSFLRPMLSYDARKVLFAWCRHYPNLARERDKMNKANVPEDAFYHLFEMNIDGTDVKKLTHGKYDDFDARYLPDGSIAFLSTRRGHFIQTGLDSAARTSSKADLPDCYVRCGGGPSRPVAVYTLHSMKADGSQLCAISPFEMFEWTPSVAHDGTILYSRWDYIDRHNMPYMSLWATNPDGTNARIVYGNHTRSPHCTFEPRSIPNSHKIVFTASAHHAQTMGSLVLLDPTAGNEGRDPLTRLTPEVKFPEAEGWSKTFYANPWPLSEQLYLVSWGPEENVRQGRIRPANGMGIYLFDPKGGKELLYRDKDISSMYPIPVRPRSKPAALPNSVDWDGPQEGTFLLTDVYRGLKTTKRGDIKHLRIVAVPPKTHPSMNRPSLGVTRDDPGKCVLGTVPVEEDGSAHFRVPSGVIVFFQALDKRGMAVQTMRTTTHVQPGQKLSCIGCHESRFESPPVKTALASLREPSKISAGPEGSWPLRFDRLVQPVLEQNCVRCHNPKADDAKAAKFDLTPRRAYQSIIHYGKPSLNDHVGARYGQGRSLEGACAASQSHFLKTITGPKGHHDVKLSAADLERLIIWMDTSAQKLGSFSEDQERRLIALRQRVAGLLIEREKKE